MFLFNQFPDFIIDFEFINSSYYNDGRETKLNISYQVLKNSYNDTILSNLTSDYIFFGKELKLTDMHFKEERYIRFNYPRSITYKKILEYICKFQKDIRSLIKNQYNVYNNYKIHPTIIIKGNELIIFNWKN